jgi:hypothetical protein
VFAFIAIVCSHICFFIFLFVVAGGSGHSLTMADSIDEEAESTQGYLSTNQPSRSQGTTMSSPPQSSSRNTSKKTPTSSTKRQSTIPSSVTYSGDDDDGLVDSMRKTKVDDGDGAETGSSAVAKQDPRVPLSFMLTQRALDVLTPSSLCALRTSSWATRRVTCGRSS